MNLEFTVRQFIINNYVYLSRKQAVLDKHIRHKKDIPDDAWYENDFYHYAHHLALKNEVNEWINECRDIWKYWKDKPVDRARVIDEFIDIIHFIALIFNKDAIVRNAIMSNDLTSLEDDIKNRINYYHFNSDDATPHDLKPLEALACLDTMERTNDIATLLINGLRIMMGYYQFTSQDIIHAYDKKNQVNFDRQNQGW